MNAGAESASIGAECLIFVHADTVLPLGYDSLVREALDDPTVMLGAFEFQVDRSSVRLWPTGLEVVEIFANWRSRWYRLPYGDQTLFMRRDDWVKTLGPFPATAMMEDFEFVREARRAAVREGRDIVTLPAPALCSGRRWEKNGTFTVTLINQIIVYGYTALKAPPS